MAEPTATDREAHAAITHRLAQVGFTLPGALRCRRMACGKSGCRCKADPPRLHGPDHQWTRMIGGKTVTRRLTEEQAAVYGPWFGNARRLRALVNEFEALSLRSFERTEG